MTQADYNLGLTLQRVGFLLAELPSQVIGKKLGVDVWIPIQLTCMSILGMAQFWTNGAASYITLRFLISLFQGGFVPGRWPRCGAFLRPTFTEFRPDAILYLSYFYTKSELPVRLSCFWAMNR